MDIYVLNPSCEVLDLVDSYESVIWNVQYYGRNEFEIVIAATEKNINLMQVDNMLCRDCDIKGEEYRNVMLIASRKITYDTEKGFVITVSGKGLKNILNRRIIWNQTIISGSVEGGIRQVITENVIAPSDDNRKIDNFEMEPEKGFEDTADLQLLGDKIAEWLESTCETYGIGWDVYIKDKKYMFYMYKGTDRTYDQTAVNPVVFSPEYDNLPTCNHTFSKNDYVNAAVVGGEGDGIDRRTVSIGTTSGLDRRETFIDGSSVSSNGEIITEAQYYEMLTGYGNDQLANSAVTQSFDGDLIPDSTYKLNEDYFLGDLVQIDSGYNIQATSRILEIIYSEDTGGSATVPTFGTWEV